MAVHFHSPLLIKYTLPSKIQSLKLTPKYERFFKYAFHSSRYTYNLLYCAITELNGSIGLKLAPQSIITGNCRKEVKLSPYCLALH